MKRNILFIACVLCAAMAGQAQVLKVASIEPLQVNQNQDKVIQAVAISPQGDYVLLSSDTKQGLVKWDINTGEASTLTTDEGAGSNVSISNNGQQIVYGEVTYKDRRRLQAVKSIDLLSGKRQTLAKATRRLQGFAIVDGTAATVTVDGKLKTHALTKGASREMSHPLLSRHHLKLYVTRQDGQTVMLAPNGPEEHYIWASLSPDAKRVLYYVSGRGAFVCDIDGSNVIAMGDLTAPRWWDDNTIVGMDETYNDEVIAASSIVARTIDGQQQVLTGSDVIATYPLPCRQAGKIAFSTPDGQIYILNVE